MIFLITLRFVLQDQWGGKVKKPQWKTLSVFLPLQSLPHSRGPLLHPPLSFWWGRAPLPPNLLPVPTVPTLSPPRASGQTSLPPAWPAWAPRSPRWLAKWHSTLFFRGSSCKPSTPKPSRTLLQVLYSSGRPITLQPTLSPAPYPPSVSGQPGG